MCYITNDSCNINILKFLTIQGETQGILPAFDNIIIYIKSLPFLLFLTNMKNNKLLLL